MITNNPILRLLLICCLLLVPTIVIGDQLPQNSTTDADQLAAAAAAAEQSDINRTVEATDVPTDTTATTLTTDQSAVINATSRIETVELIADGGVGNQSDQAQEAAVAATQQSDQPALNNNTGTEQSVPASATQQSDQPALNNNTGTEQSVFALPSDQNVTQNGGGIDEQVHLIEDNTAEKNETTVLQQQQQAVQAVPATQPITDQDKNNTTEQPPTLTVASTNDPNITLNFTVESMQLITDNGTTQSDQTNVTMLNATAIAESSGAELGAHEGDVPLLSSGLADEQQNAKNESIGGTTNGTTGSSDLSSGMAAIDVTKFIPHADDDCWTDQNGEDTPRWFAAGEQLERGIVWYACQKGKLMTLGCIDENGKRLELNGTYQSGRYRMKCVPFGENARRQVIGCVPDSQLDQTYLPGETWVDNQKQIWWQCVLENAWVGGCVDEANGNRLNVGDAIDRNLTTYECQYKHFDGFRMVPIGCIFDGTRYSVGLYWQDDDFLFYCKLQKDDAGADAASTTCIDCILRNQRLFNDDHELHDEHAVKCAQRLAPDGYPMCVR